MVERFNSGGGTPSDLYRFSGSDNTTSQGQQTNNRDLYSWNNTNQSGSVRAGDQNLTSTINQSDAAHDPFAGERLGMQGNEKPYRTEIYFSADGRNEYINNFYNSANVISSKGQRTKIEARQMVMDGSYKQMCRDYTNNEPLDARNYYDATSPSQSSGYTRTVNNSNYEAGYNNFNNPNSELNRNSANQYYIDQYSQNGYPSQSGFYGNGGVQYGPDNLNYGNNNSHDNNGSTRGQRHYGGVYFPGGGITHGGDRASSEQAGAGQSAGQQQQSGHHGRHG
jgi:hypothetical protein